MLTHRVRDAAHKGARAIPTDQGNARGEEGMRGFISHSAKLGWVADNIAKDIEGGMCGHPGAQVDSLDVEKHFARGRRGNASQYGLLHSREACESANDWAVKRRQQQKTADREVRRKVQDLERELQRKNAALAETVALLTLSKTARAIWGKARTHDQHPGAPDSGNADQRSLRKQGTARAGLVTSIRPLQYIASESTMYRVLREEGLRHHWGRVKAPSASKPPTTHCASRPNQTWCLDITWLPGPIRGQFFFLYLILDLFSRKIVGWEVHDSECGEHASVLAERTVWRERCVDKPVVLHGDNGSLLKGATVQTMLGRLGITASYSRPRVSNYNAYAESIFRHLKYAPAFPRNGFESLEAARDWVPAFVVLYNTQHCHRGINYVTPQQRHDGLDVEILAKRHEVYQTARARHPNRWSGDTRNWARPEHIWLNLERPEAPDQQAA